MKKVAGKVLEHVFKNGALLVLATGIITPLAKGEINPNLNLVSALVIMILVAAAIGSGILGNNKEEKET